MDGGTYTYTLEDGRVIRRLRRELRYQKRLTKYYKDMIKTLASSESGYVSAFINEVVQRCLANEPKP